MEITRIFWKISFSGVEVWKTLAITQQSLPFLVTCKTSKTRTTGKILKSFQGTLLHTLWLCTVSNSYIGDCVHATAGSLIHFINHCMHDCFLCMEVCTDLRQLIVKCYYASLIPIE